MSSYNKIEALQNVQLLTQASNPAVLNLTIKRADEFIQTYCSFQVVPAVLQSAVEDLAIFYYNRIGREDLKSESTGSSYSASFLEDIPAHILRTLNIFKPAKVLSRIKSI